MSTSSNFPMVVSLTAYGMARGHSRAVAKETAETVLEGLKNVMAKDFDDPAQHLMDEFDRVSELHDYGDQDAG